MRAVRELDGLRCERSINGRYTPLRSSSVLKSGLAQVRMSRGQQLPGSARSEAVTGFDSNAKYVVKLSFCFIR